MSHDKARELDSYLSLMREPGQIDSEGVFTISGLKAIGKLGSSLLRNKEDWILKVIQAACVGGASSLNITQTKSSTQIRYLIPHEFSMPDLERALTAPLTESENPGLNELASGLRALDMGQNRDWVAKVHVRGQVFLIGCSDSSISSRRTHAERDIGEQTDISLGISYPAGESGKIGGLVRFGTAIQNEHSILLAKARACPIPLFLDGRRIDDLFESRKESVYLEHSFLGVMASKPDSDLSIQIPGALKENEGFQVQDRFATNAPFYLPPFPEDRKASALLRWHYNYEIFHDSTKKKNREGSFSFAAVPTPSRIHLVRHGVVVGTGILGITHPISVNIFLPAEHLRSDLSGLTAKTTDVEVELAKQKIRQSGPFLRELCKALKAHKARPRKKDLLVYGGLGALGLIFPVFAVKAVAGAATALAYQRAAKTQKRLIEDCAMQLRDIEGRLKLTNR